MNDQQVVLYSFLFSLISKDGNIMIMAFLRDNEKFRGSYKLKTFKIMKKSIGKNLYKIFDKLAEFVSCIEKKTNSNNPTSKNQQNELPTKGLGCGRCTMFPFAHFIAVVFGLNNRSLF